MQRLFSEAAQWRVVDSFAGPSALLLYTYTGIEQVQEQKVTKRASYFLLVLLRLTDIAFRYDVLKL